MGTYFGNISAYNSVRRCLEPSVRSHGKKGQSPWYEKSVKHGFQHLQNHNEQATWEKLSSKAHLIIQITFAKDKFTKSPFNGKDIG
jgi:hypothetical protein